MINSGKRNPPKSSFRTDSGFNNYIESANRSSKTKADIIRRQATTLKEASMSSTNKLRSMDIVTQQKFTGDISQFISADSGSNVTRYATKKFMWGNKRFNSSGENTFNAYSPRQHSQFENKMIASTGQNATDVVVVDNNLTTVNNIIGLTQLAQICGLPPLSDNVVDPSPTLDQSELSADLLSWGTGGRVGKEYIERVLLRGQYLVLVPIELKAQLGNVILESNIVGKGANAVTNYFKIGNKIGNSVNNFLDSLDNRLGVTTYGYNTKVNHRRYWLAVGSHMKAVLHCLGIVDKIFDNGNWVGLPQVLGAGGDDSEITFAGYDQLSSEMKGLIDKVGKSISNKLDNYAAVKSFKARYEDTVKAAVKQFKGDYGSVYKRGGVGMFSAMGFLAQGEYDDGANSVGLDQTPISLYNSSYSNILAAVTNIDLDRGAKTWNLPFITFYCNGPIERSLNFSLTAERSKIGETITDVGAKTLAGIGDFMKNVVGEMTSHPAAKMAESISSKVSEAVQSNEDIIKELVYHNGATSEVLDTIITNTYIPKVITDGSTSQSWTVNIREVAAGSDKYSQARMFWTLCLLLPMVLQKTKPRQPMIIPTNPMYCAAFSKGVMNCPRAYISSMSIKTDPAFQTTNGVPLELDITLTIEPLFTVTTMPDFTDAWGGVSDINLLNAMWNPMSSFNMIATLSGANTVLSRIPNNIFQFFVGAPVNQAFNKFRAVFGENGGYFATYLRDWRRSYDLEDNYSYLQ